RGGPAAGPDAGGVFRAGGNQRTGADAAAGAGVAEQGPRDRGRAADHVRRPDEPGAASHAKSEGIFQGKTAEDGDSPERAAGRGAQLRQTGHALRLEVERGGGVRGPGGGDSGAERDESSEGAQGSRRGCGAPEARSEGSVLAVFV